MLVGYARVSTHDQDPALRCRASPWPHRRSPAASGYPLRPSTITSLAGAEPFFPKHQNHSPRSRNWHLTIEERMTGTRMTELSFKDKEFVHDYHLLSQQLLQPLHARGSLTD
tara:strand:+ start:179 stop:514 length:336 start_codon:yes stop_codon:yes gene_type:complete